VKKAFAPFIPEEQKPEIPIAMSPLPQQPPPQLTSEVCFFSFSSLFVLTNSYNNISIASEEERSNAYNSKI
jgi:hypothetical protein